MTATFKINEDEVTEKLKVYLMEYPQFKSYVVSVDDENAVYLEFGTRPASRAYKNKKKKSKTYENIRQWTANKVGNTTISWTVYKNIMEKGMRPYPFMRPALHEIEEDVRWNPQSYDGTKALANALAQKMKENVKDHDYMNKISETIHVRVFKGEYKESDMEGEERENIDSVLDSDTLSLDGRDSTVDSNWRRQKRNE